MDSTEMVPTALATTEEEPTQVIHDEEDLPPVSEEDAVRADALTEQVSE